MKRYTGNETVEPGIYMNLRQFSFEAKDVAGPLPGGPQDVYRRVPVLLLFALAPVIGLAFVVFLPLVAFATVGWAALVKTGEAVGAVVTVGARAVRPGWEPALAFFSRSKRAKKTEPEPDAWAEDAEKKLDSADDDKP